MFVEALPGFPDGVSLSADGASFWVAIIAIPQPAVLALARAPAPLSRLLRWVVAHLPEAVQPKAQPYGLVVQVIMAFFCRRGAGSG